MDHLLAQAYFKSADPRVATIFLIVIGAVIAVAVVVAALRRAAAGDLAPSGGAAGSAGGGRSGQPRPFTHGSFRRQADEAGLSDAEADFLERYAKQMGTASPKAVFGSIAQLDGFLKAAYKQIERTSETEAKAETEKERLFAIREAMALRLSSGSSFRSTRQLPRRTPLSLVSSKQAHYATVLASMDGKHLLVEPPLDAFGQPIKLPRGDRMTAYFYTGDHVGFSFETRPAGMVNVEGRSLLALSHGERIKPMPARRHQRREVRISCRFNLVHIRTTTSGGKPVRTAQVEKASVAGVVTDISAGGMSLQTMSPVAAGDTIKLEFELGSTNLGAYASVVRVTRTRSGATLHLRFMKAATRTIHTIMAFVYGYE